MKLLGSILGTHDGFVSRIFGIDTVFFMKLITKRG